MMSRPSALGDTWTVRGGGILHQGRLVPGRAVRVRRGRIEAISPGRAPRGGPSIDAEGLKVLPGFIDLHLHCDPRPGAAADFASRLRQISTEHARFGTTRFLATFCAATPGAVRRLARSFHAFRTLPGALALGCHIEGPFLNAGMAGAQPREAFAAPSKRILRDILDAFGGTLRLMTLAPELHGIREVIRELVRRGVRAGMGHTDATYDQAVSGIRNGISYGTHVFNRMRGLHHRELGAAGAAILDEKLFVELIADGVHLNFLMLKLLTRMISRSRIVLATDCYAALKSDTANRPPRLRDGSLAGSALSLRRAVLNMAQFCNLSLEDAVEMAALNPARVLGIEQDFGSLQKGKWADLVLVDPSFNVRLTMAAGRVVYVTRRDEWRVKD